MPNVTAPTRNMSNGDVVTQFIDSVGITPVTYTYPKTQEKFIMRNMGPSSLSVTVAGVTQVIERGEKWQKIADFNSFTINAVSGRVAFDAWVDEKGSTFDTAEGKYFQSNGGGTGGGSGVISFTTLSDLQTAIPNGSTTPAWVVAENSWYYWSGEVLSDTTAPTVSISPTPGTFAVTQLATLTANETATIYYTIDGSTPTTNSSVYSSSISVSSTTTIKYFAKDTAGNSSAVQTATYTIDVAAPDTTAPTVNISPVAGTYTSTQSVTLTGSDNSGGAVTIYYTTDGSTPTQSSAVYSSPISVPATGTIKYFGKDTAGNVSAAQTASYTITVPDSTPPEEVTNLAAGTPTSSIVPLTWTASIASDISKYEVAYSTDGTNFAVANSNVTGTSYTVTSLPANTLHTFRVVAIDTSNNRSTAVTTTATTTAVGSGETVLVSDTFNRADTTITADSATTLGTTDTGQTWTNRSVFWNYGVIGNQAYQQRSNNGGSRYRHAALVPCTALDYAVEVTLATMDAAVGKESIHFRNTASANTDLFFLLRTTTSYVLTKNVYGGSESGLPYGRIVPAQGDRVRIESYQDGRIRVYVNGVLDQEVKDTFIATMSTRVGIACDTNTPRFEDFKVLQLSPLPADTTPPAEVTAISASGIQQTSMTLSWTNPVTTDFKEVEIYNGATLVATVAPANKPQLTTSISYTVSGLTANTNYTFTLKAKDWNGNVSTGASITRTTLT